MVDPGGYDWEGDAPLGRPFAKTIIYQIHVGGFTRHPSSRVAPSKRCTYAGLIDKIPYLQDLDVSAVELLPVFAFDEQDGPPGLGNYWEGPTDPEVEPLRSRQVKNFLTLILLATGTPMLLMGDEVRCSRGGNNNAYCQNNEISWFDWTVWTINP